MGRGMTSLPGGWGMDQGIEYQRISVSCWTTGNIPEIIELGMFAESAPTPMSRPCC